MHGSKEYVNSLTKKEKDNIVLMINIDSILAGDNLYLYGGRINDKGVVKDVEAVNKAFEIAKKANLPMQLTPKGNVDYPYPTGQKRSDHAPFSDIGIPYIYFEANNWHLLGHFLNAYMIEQYENSDNFIEKFKKLNDKLLNNSGIECLNDIGLDFNSDQVISRLDESMKYLESKFCKEKTK